MANDVRIGVGVKDTASSALDKIRDKFDQLGASKGAQSILMGVGLAAGQMAFNALGKAASAAGDLITGSVDAAKQQEVASAKLDQALRNNGSSYAANADAIEEATRKGVDLGFNDDLITDGMARLVSATGSVSKAAYAMGIAQDLARLKGISLEEATLALTSIEGGRFRALATLGIVLQKGATVEDALSAVRAKASGQAEAFARTETGAWDRVGAKWDQAKEQLGNMLLPILKDLANFIADNMVPALEAFGRGWDKATTALKFVLQPIFNVADAIRYAADAVGHGVDAAADLGNGYNALGQKLPAVGKSFNNLGYAVAQTGAQVATVTGTVGKSSQEWGKHASAVGMAAATVGTAVFDSSTAATKAAGVIDTAMDSIGDSFKSAADAAIAAVKAEITGAYDPQITAAELVVARLALADDKKKRSAKGVTTAEKAQLDLQIINDRMHIAQIEAQQLASGTAAQQIAKINGYLTGKAHAAALKSTNPQEQEAAETLETTLRAVLAKIKGDAGPFGTNTGAAYVNSLAAALRRTTGIRTALGNIANMVRASSPPGPESPLHEIDKWGTRTGETYMDKFAGAISGGKSGVSGALAGLAPAFAGGGGFSGGGSGGVNLTVHYSPQLSTATSGEMERAARVLGPAIVRELRGRGLIPQGSY